MMNKYFAMVLHAHLPYVRHQEENRMEERWLFEAMTESYIPLLWMLDRSSNKVSLTISFSPPLMEMLADPLLQTRYIHYLDKLDALLNLEANSSQHENEKQLVIFYQQRIKKVRETFHSLDQNLLLGFKHFIKEGKLSCICSSATHAILPFLQTNEGIKAQIHHGIKCFQQHFGFKPKGFWLPECAYSPGIDQILYEEGIRFTFIEEQALITFDKDSAGNPKQPVFSPGGIVLFPRYSALSAKVWSSTNGYPGHDAYREFYRDVAFERDLDYLEPFLYPGDVRVGSGLKYWRVTGQTEEKQFYRREDALEIVKNHSEDFIRLATEELEKNEQSKQSLVITSFDAELFGHWWFEGPEWLQLFFKNGESTLHFVTAEKFIQLLNPTIETKDISFHTWGRNGYGEVWLNEKNSWIYRILHQMEVDIIDMNKTLKEDSEIKKRCLKQMVREWMLASSSDWAFMIDGGTTSNYAVNRINEHVERFNKLRNLFFAESLIDGSLREFETSFPFLDDIDLKVFLPFPHINNLKHTIHLEKRTILMLAWEYPPMIIGGLARHVHDLSIALVKQGYEIHVITTSPDNIVKREHQLGVNIHRVMSLQPQAESFYDWVGSFNLAICDYVEKLALELKFDFIHAHDWLVSVSARALKQHLGIPLIATIHATEHGRNNGIWTELQQKISKKEWELTYDATSVIVCSKYMKEELTTIFQLPKDKISIIPNGVNEPINPDTKESWKKNYGSSMDIFIFSVGRIVREKGFQTVIDATPAIISRYPNVKFIIAGKGPLLEYYRRQVLEKNLDRIIYFIGFITDEFRNQLFSECDICIFPSYYEPFGIVALEAMIANKPTIVSDTGGLSEIITHKETGLKIFPKDTKSLIDQITLCLEDKDLAEKIARQGRELAQTDYSWDAIANETIRVYQSCFPKEKCIGG